MEFLNCIQHISLSVGAICCIVMQQDLVFMMITDQGIKETCRRVQIRTGNTSFRFNIDTTHTAFVLFNLSCLQRIQYTELNHRPFDRIGTFFIEVSNVFTFQVLHRTELHLDHCIVNMAHLVFKFHVTLEDFSLLISLRNFSEECIEHKVMILNSIANREVLSQVTFA